RDLAASEWVVDALFGTGLRRPGRGPLGAVSRAINDSHARLFAVDIPSGLDCDTGRPLGPTVRAEHSSTFVAPKKGFQEAASKEWLGAGHGRDNGAPRGLG